MQGKRRSLSRDRPGPKGTGVPASRGGWSAGPVPRDPDPADSKAAFLATLDNAVERSRGGSLPAPPIFVAPPHPASLAPEVLRARCLLHKDRSGGPGGQNRNKVETMVTLVHTATAIEASASERRTVRENMPVALRRLRLALAVHVRCAVPTGDARSMLWKSRCPSEAGHAGRPRGAIILSPLHDDYPAMLAEALDCIRACGFDAGPAALRLACTPSQLVKLVQSHPPAFVAWNTFRKTAGLRTLR